MTQPRKTHIRQRDLELLERLVRERTSDLERANERLFLANQVKGEFLAHISRELRDPLNRIIDEATLFMEGGQRGKGDGKGVLRTIAAHSRRLRDMVDRILELCRLDIGTVRFLPREFRVVDALERVLAETEGAAALAGVAVTVRYGGKPEFIVADEEKFRFVLAELVTNAIKFSPHGTRVRLRVREILQPGDGERSFLEVAVTDEGTGIGPEDLERIFLGFERGAGSDEEAGSLGIGLALVRRFVELHGGKIWVASHPAKGSTFTFILPTGGPQPEEGEPPTVMVADADAEGRSDLVHLLEGEGFEVVEAADGMTVLTDGTASPPDLFLLGLDLGDMDGIDVCLRLKSHTGTRFVPVVLVAREEARSEQVRSVQAGADGFFGRPAEEGALLPKIRMLIGQKRHYESLKRSYQIAAAEATTDPMTGLYNVRQLWLLLDRELERARRYGHRCSLAMIDIDSFKEYNDRHGHLQGDEVLKRAAELFREQIRNSDSVARYGGEEFVLIMPETGKKIALVVGEKLRLAFELCSFPHEETQPGGRLTISMGVATFPDDADNARTLLDLADQALYEAKRAGKNRVIARAG